MSTGQHYTWYCELGYLIISQDAKVFFLTCCKKAAAAKGVVVGTFNVTLNDDSMIDLAVHAEVALLLLPDSFLFVIDMYTGYARSPGRNG